MSDFLETFLENVYSSLQSFWPPLVCVAILSECMNTKLNTIEINLYTLQSVS